MPRLCNHGNAFKSSSRPCQNYLDILYGEFCSSSVVNSNQTGLSVFISLSAQLWRGFKIQQAHMMLVLCSSFSILITRERNAPYSICLPGLLLSMSTTIFSKSSHTTLKFSFNILAICFRINHPHTFVQYSFLQHLCNHSPFWGAFQ